MFKLNYIYVHFYIAYTSRFINIQDEDNIVVQDGLKKLSFKLFFISSPNVDGFFYRFISHNLVYFSENRCSCFL